MNLVAKIKRLELEAAERDKRIAALESLMVASATRRSADCTVACEPRGSQEVWTAPPSKPPKKKTRAKTYGTE